MKIKELSKLTDVNTETIRMYRNKGLLMPTQEFNGYYDYDFDDLMMLLFIRKQRGTDIALDTIKYTYTHAEPDEIINRYESEYAEIEAKISDLRKQQDMLRMHIDHYLSYKESEYTVSKIKIEDDRIDLPFNPLCINPMVLPWLKNIDRFIQGLHLPDNWFIDLSSQKYVKASFCIGTYMPIFERYSYEIPKDAIITPKGDYITCKVELCGDGLISASQLAPLVDYAMKNGLRLTNDSAAFIFRVDTSGKNTKYIFRLRVRVEEL